MNITLENIVSKAQSIINSFFRKETQATVIQETKAQFQLGDIFVESWGYEQTNVDFYQVIKVNKASVVLRKIGSKSLQATGWASDEVEPLKDDFVGEQTWTKRTKQGSKYLNGIACGVLVLHDNGRSYHRSWYA
ncbi:hypothetical protein [Sphingobacterium thalpophilum]|uniref:hypothetical protein n=1 Tax=Sphingobacterium thalpophilum TaxID=259 RepID=UPI003D965B1F